MARVLPGYRKQAKERIITDSFPVFIEHGYHGTTMDEVAEHLNISKGTLYLYFKNKEELFREVAASIRARNREELYSLLQREDIPFTPVNIFNLFMRASEDYASFAFELYAASVHNDALRKILEEDAREDLLLCQEFIEQLKEKGILKPDANSRILAGGIISVFFGLFALVHLGTTREDAIRIWDTMFGKWMVEK